MDTETLALLADISNRLENSRGGVQADISGFKVLQTSGRQYNGAIAFDITGEGYVRELIITSIHSIFPIQLIVDGKTFDCSNATTDSKTTLKLNNIEFKRNIKALFTGDTSYNYPYTAWMLYKLV